jgi:HPt (histidine-containing phosphotransfer) domain-containing protein
LRRWLPQVRDAEKGPSCVDTQVLEQIRALRGNGGTDLLAKIIGIYLSDAPIRLRSLQEAVARGDAGAMARAAHAFKSSSANLGAMGLAELCRRMEDLGRASSTSGAESLVAEIETQYTRVAAELSVHAGSPES